MATPEKIPLPTQIDKELTKLKANLAEIKDRGAASETYINEKETQSAITCVKKIRELTAGAQQIVTTLDTLKRKVDNQARQLNFQFTDTSCKLANASKKQKKLEKELKELQDNCFLSQTSDLDTSSLQENWEGTEDAIKIDADADTFPKLLAVVSDDAETPETSSTMQPQTDVAPSSQTSKDETE